MGQTSDAAPGSLVGGGGGGGQDGYYAQQYSQARRQRALLLPLNAFRTERSSGECLHVIRPGASLVCE